MPLAMGSSSKTNKYFLVSFVFFFNLVFVHPFSAPSSFFLSLSIGFFFNLSLCFLSHSPDFLRVQLSQDKCQRQYYCVLSCHHSLCYVRHCLCVSVCVCVSTRVRFCLCLTSDSGLLTVHNHPHLSKLRPDT